jgi:hypothetical protein
MGSIDDIHPAHLRTSPVEDDLYDGQEKMFIFSVRLVADCDMNDI